jgi:hypothetical protein
MGLSLCIMPLGLVVKKPRLRRGLFVIIPSQKGGIFMKISVHIGKFKINLAIDLKEILALVRFFS